MVTIREITKGPKHHFFGYYNLCPWNKTEEFLLGLETEFIDRHPSKKDAAKIVLINSKSNQMEKIASTKAWCWQQSCMLQWMPPYFKENIIFNDRMHDKFVSVILNIKTKKKKIIPFPVFAIHPSGKYGLGLNFSRLNKVRKGYGYEGVKDPYEKENIPQNEGIHLINFKTKKRKLIVSLKTLSEYNPLETMKNGKHWVDHIEFNHSGNRFCFFHRWETGGGLFYTRLFTSDIEGKDLHCFPDSGFYSHIKWKNDLELFGWGSNSKLIGDIRKNKRKFNILVNLILPIYRKIIPSKLRKKILPASYFLWKDKSQKIKKVKINYEDGHSSFSKKERLLITDTYPNKKGYRNLILYDWLKKKKRLLGKFYSIPSKNNIKSLKWGTEGISCDLHPRWDRKGEKICIDSVHKSSRQMYVIYL